MILIGARSSGASGSPTPHSAIGLDGALVELAHSSYGPALLGVVAAGLAGFALFSLVEARYREI
jgi:hypothetical protein